MEQIEQSDDAIDVGEVYLTKRTDGTVHPAQVIQARFTEFNYYEYYVHYVGLNRRLDQWVNRSRILYPSSSPDSIEPTQVTPGLPLTTPATNVNNQTTNTSVESPAATPFDSHLITSAADDSSDRKITRNQKRRHDEINHVQKTYAEMDPTTAALEKEHEAITKVKYIDKLRIGKFEIDTWYFSPYPDEYGKVSTLYVCEYCLIYMKLGKTYRYHQVSCHRHKILLNASNKYFL